MSEHFKSIFDQTNKVIDMMHDDRGIDPYRSLAIAFRSLKIRKWVKHTLSKYSIGEILRAIATGKSLVH
jgi:hypothetical protein